MMVSRGHRNVVLNMIPLVIFIIKLITSGIYRLLHLKKPDIVFIHEFLIPYCERASLRGSEQYGIKNE